MRRFRCTAAAFAVGILLASLAAASAHAAGSAYVALGDSYSSGTGTGSYLNDGTSCQRSVYAYPSLIASSEGYALNFRACSGAVVADVTNLQLGALGAATTYVSITVGGNDAGFASVLTECAKPAWASNCNGAIDQSQSIITNQLPERLATLYASIRSRAPQARVVVAGYPRLFNGEDCNLLTWFSAAEESRLNATADLLNARIKTAADAAGLLYRNPTSNFTGHAVCDDIEWINGLSNPTSESYHPNRAGHTSGYTPLVGAALSGSPVTVTPAAVQTAAASAVRLTKQQRAYTAQDRLIRPKVFKIPNLNTLQIKKAAARAGVDLTSQASIDAADKRYAAEQAKQHQTRR
jgi:lysophospholipase L1-like esterase